MLLKILPNIGSDLSWLKKVPLLILNDINWYIVKLKNIG